MIEGAAGEDCTVVANVPGSMTFSTEGAERDETAGLARSLTALRLGLELLGDAVAAGGRPGLDPGVLAETLDAVVRRVVGAAGVLLSDPTVA